VALLAGCLIWPTFAAGEGAAGEDIEQARVHVRKATAAYNLGRYVEAANEYEAAYETTLDPNLLFNVGQAWRLASEPQKALTAYRSYLRSAPNGERRETAEAKIREIEAQPPSEPAPTDGRIPAAATTPPAASATPTVTQTPPPASETPALAPSAAPSAPAAAAPSATPLALIDTSAKEADQPSPFYRHWPFWSAVGAVVAAGVVTGIILSGGSGELTMPGTTYGAKHF
jgi:tetratricopeptide (TPR) repeat protein